MELVLDINSEIASRAHPSSGTRAEVLAVFDSPGSDQGLRIISEAFCDEITMQRRAHRKSKAGCSECKRRRVKCDEHLPCANCTRRRTECVSMARSTKPSCRSRAQAATKVPAVLQNRPYNAAGRYVHHFATQTVGTLMLYPEVWEGALRLASSYEFLNDIIQCVAARHMQTLGHHDSTQLPDASNLLARGLRNFRSALCHDLTSTHVDSFVATSLLLLHYVWDDVEDPLASSSCNLPDDTLFTISSSLKQVFLKSVRLAPGQDSIFMPSITRDPTGVLLEAAMLDELTLERFQDMFSILCSIELNMLSLGNTISRSTSEERVRAWSKHLDSGYRAKYGEAVARLCLVMSFLPEARPPEPVVDNPELLHEVARYIISFPIMCRGEFAQLVHQRHAHAMMVLYHFYRTASTILPHDKYWWAYKRATVAQAYIRAWLESNIGNGGQV